MPNFFRIKLDKNFRMTRALPDTKEVIQKTFVDIKSKVAKRLSQTAGQLKKTPGTGSQ